jgi:long-chain acyl-CoA synthetase
VFGLTMLMVFPLSVGGTMVMTNAISRHNLLQLLSQHRVTFACLVPDLLRLMSEQLRPGRAPATLPPLEPKLMVYAGGSHLSGDVAAELSERLGGRPVLQGYGLTECMPVVLQSSHRAWTPGALGRPIRCTEWRIIDADGHDVEIGQIGELIVRGPTVAAGYVDDAEATARFFRDGWLHTGDLVTRDADGEIGFIGRRLRITKVMAQMIDLAEIESAASSHPSVRRARARVVRDAQGRNSVSLSVLVDATSSPEAINAHLSAQLAAFKRPRHVELVPASGQR